ncbi:MAG: YfcE family phosphodiesterase [Gemmatimonadetes bacterium]|nr:YfcE family phosphodiesterase [Gemmatimonadota bacterium]
MLIGLMADTHDRVPAVRDLLKEMTDRGVAMVLHAGDYCSPFSLQPFQDAGVALAGVFGHNDGDPQGLKAFAEQGMGHELFESPHSITIGDQKILIVHDIGDVSLRSIKQHNIVVHGMEHQQSMKTRGDSLIICPGEACGWIHGAPTAAVLDLESKQVEFIKLAGDKWHP